MKNILNFKVFNERKEISIKELPEDLQTYLFEIFEDSKKNLPHKFTIKEISLDKIKNIELDINRGKKHAEKMIGKKTPPIIISDGKLIDGGHRIYAKKQEGKKYILAIDLSGIIKPQKNAPTI